MGHYLRVFNFLWRAKRMEYTLTDIWKGQMCNGKLLKTMPGTWININVYVFTFFFLPCLSALICESINFMWDVVFFPQTLKALFCTVAICLQAVKVITWHYLFFYLLELSGVLHQCHILASEMVHFIHQMQYYITFEVNPLAGLLTQRQNCLENKYALQLKYRRRM